MNARTPLAVLAILSLSLCISCGDDSVTDTGGADESYSRATPEDLIRALAHSMEERDILIYSECLHDEYLFTFVAKDAELVGLPSNQPWWGKTPDVGAVGNIFSESTVTSIDCDLPVKSGPWPTADGVGYRLEPIIRIVVEPEDATEPTVFLVNACWFDIEIVEDPYDNELWVFKGIQETLKQGLRAVEPSTFGGLKGLFHR
jgi:hypothetical protein